MTATCADCDYTATGDDAANQLWTHATLTHTHGMADDTRERMTAPGVLAGTALYYAAHGWPVFPLTVGGKVPLTRTGFKAATCDITRVREWWTATPEANIGVPTGLLFDVVDIDAPRGFATFADHIERWRELGHNLPEVLAIAHTGNGGRHLLVHTNGHGNGANLGVGLDYRGGGGYIVVPPSRLTTGDLYTWITAPTFEGVAA